MKSTFYTYCRLSLHFYGVFTKPWRTSNSKILEGIQSTIPSNLQSYTWYPIVPDLIPINRILLRCDNFAAVATQSEPIRTGTCSSYITNRTQRRRHLKKKTHLGSWLRTTGRPPAAVDFCLDKLAPLGCRY